MLLANFRPVLGTGSGQTSCLVISSLKVWGMKKNSRSEIDLEFFRMPHSG